jgi:hypothetical protein
LQPLCGRHRDPVIVVPEQAVLAGVGIDGEQSDARLLDFDNGKMVCSNNEQIFHTRTNTLVRRF